MMKSRCLFTMTVWASLTAGFVAYRTSDFFVWNDGASVMIRPDDGGWTDANEHHRELRAKLSTVPVHFMECALRDAFDKKREECDQSGGYRPLSSLQTTFSQLLMKDDSPTWWHLVLWGSGYATFAVCFYFVAKRFVMLPATAVLAVALMLFSPPCVAASWVIVAGFQVLVPLWICASLLLYWHTVEVARYRIWSAGALCTMLLLGPWIREFLGIVPVLIGCLELYRGRRPTIWLGLAAAFFAHAAFPTALLKFLILPDLPLLPVSRLGHLGSQMSASGLRWHAGWHFIPLYPPTLLVIAGISAFFYRRSAVDHQRRGWPLVAGSIRALLPWLWVAAFAICLIGGPLNEALPVVLCLAVAVLGFQLDAFLGLWFLMSFLPMLRVFTEHVHFMYTLVPASIILAGALEKLWFAPSEIDPARLPRLHAFGRRARWAVPVLGALFVADQSLTLYGSWNVMHAQYAGIQHVARHLRQNIPRGSAVVGNVVHFDEIKWLTDSYFQAYYSIGAGIAIPQREVDPDQLTALLKDRQARPVYLLDCDFERTATKSNYHRHKYVHRSKIVRDDMGTVHTTQVRYPFLDPLRHFVRNEHVPFLGPPDLVDDFYCGRGRAPAPFCLEMYAVYRLFRVDGDDVETYSPADLRLVEETQGFNVLTDGKFWFAIPQGDGAFDIERLIGRGYSHQFTGRSIDAVREQVCEFTRRTGGLARVAVRPPEPRLLFEGTDGFNLVQFGNVIYGFPQSAGPFDKARALDGGYDDLAQGDSVESVKQQIDAFKQAALEREDKH